MNTRKLKLLSHSWVVNVTWNGRVSVINENIVSPAEQKNKSESLKVTTQWVIMFLFWLKPQSKFSRWSSYFEIAMLILLAGIDVFFFWVE